MASIDYLDNDNLEVKVWWCDRDDEYDFAISIGEFSVVLSMLEVKEIRKVIEQKLPRNMSSMQ